MKRILFLARFMYPPLGGGEYFIASCLNHLQNKGYKCVSACYYEPSTNMPFSQENFTTWQNIPVFQFQPKGTQQLRDLYSDIKPDLVITQSYDAPIIVDIAKEMGIKTILGTHFWRNICNTPDHFKKMLTRPKNSLEMLYPLHRVFHTADELYVNSEFMQKAVEKFVGVKIDRIIQPMLNEERVVCQDNFEKKYITLINSDVGKGGRIFIEIAKQMPNQQFLVVGLGAPIIPDNIRINKELRSIPNVKVLEKTDDMASIYGQTKMLLIPSLVDETFSMVALEGMANSLPILYSPNGNLPYLIKDAGVVLPEENINAWVETLKNILEDEEYYSLLCNISKKRASLFSPQKELDSFEEMVRNCIGDPE